MNIIKSFSLFEAIWDPDSTPNSNKSGSNLDDHYKPGRTYNSTSTNDIFGKRFSLNYVTNNAPRVDSVLPEKDPEIPGYVEDNILNRRSDFLNRARKDFFELKTDLKDLMLPLKDDGLKYSFEIDYDGDNLTELFDVILNIVGKPSKWSLIKYDILQLVSYLNSEYYDFLSMDVYSSRSVDKTKPITTVLNIHDLEILDDFTFSEINFRFRLEVK